jgi:hypothetical protein
MGLLSSSKPVPALWFTQGPARAGVRPSRAGPFTRAAVLEMWARGDLDGDVLVWTNEKLFPSPDHRSGRLVRIEEWRRWVELPDPVRRRLEAAARAAAEPAAAEPHEPVVDEVASGGAQYDPYAAANYMSVGAPSQPPEHRDDDGGGYAESNKIR